MSLNNITGFQSLLSVDGNINAIIIGLITVGLITIITVSAYSFENIINNTDKKSVKIALQITEGVILAVCMILVQHIFKALNSGDTRSWFYATTQLTLLLYSLYTMQNYVIEFMNIAMPIYVFGHHLIHGDNNYLLLFVILTILLAITVNYISRNTNQLLNSEWKYIILQVIYGAIWWVIIWSFHRFTLYYTVSMLVGFIIYMSIIRYIAKWIRDSFNNYNALSEKVNYDELTGIRNRANFDDVSREVFKVYSKDHEVPLTMAMFDIDHFKIFNDNYGHAAGDMVLRHVATLFEKELFKKTSRGQIFRFGGEEFVIIFRGTTSEEATTVIQEIRNDLINDPVEYEGQELNIRISLGVSSLQPSDNNASDLFNRVDKYLYESKNQGRDRITVEDKTIVFN
ncbi:GGDEF domain-containing protein [Companilactobacillus baiquanensis]|uniref:GGDEF domain-containing protein n=1 Tax=Companilactobacillus baiquanensis TaxID=2486005 RepID=A0ABW1UWL5_9LACO|nr:GGDEF domain-containing protein [Companilactobacillus baiquanensis]